MTMKGKMVHPDKRKGLVYVYQSDDSLMHFCWKDRTTGKVDDVSESALLHYRPPATALFRFKHECKMGELCLNNLTSETSYV